MNWRDRFRERFNELGISQTEFAEILGVSPQRLSNWINSTKEPSIEYLSNIIKELGVTADWFLFGVKNKRSSAILDSGQNTLKKLNLLSIKDRKRLEAAIEILLLTNN